MKLHEILRKIRRDRNFTQQNLADELEIDVATYNRYEKDGSVIQVEQLEKIAKFYKLSVVELLSYNDPESSMVINEPSLSYEKKRKTVTVTIELDGQKSTVDFWIEKIKKINAAMN